MANKLILHDLQPEQAQNIIPDGHAVFAASPAVRHCIGCFGCWVKTPGRCIINDRGREFLAEMANCDELIVISRCVFGGLSPDVKAALDRSIGYILPYFRMLEGEMHHVPRYPKEINLNYLMYGDITEGEKQTAARLVKANAINFNAARHEARFFDSPDEVKEMLP